MTRALMGVLYVGVFLLAVTSLAAPHASAGVFKTGTGTMKLLESVEAAPSTTADGNIFVYLQNTWEMTGALGGSLVSNPSLVIHPNGLFTFTETAAFSGTVDGKSGTLAWRSSGTGDGVNFVGRFSILLSTGELASLRGQGTFELHPEGEALVGTYSVSYLLGP